MWVIFILHALFKQRFSYYDNSLCRCVNINALYCSLTYKYCTHNCVYCTYNQQGIVPINVSTLLYSGQPSWFTEQNTMDLRDYLYNCSKNVEKQEVIFQSVEDTN